ncbi:MAG: PAS domain S-box protein [Sterolibacterium sp.]|nr:PAS domain S-box protein [Sterolibacterium sp.]
MPHNLFLVPAPLDWRAYLSAVLLPCLIITLAMIGLGVYGYGLTYQTLKNNLASELRAIAQLKVSQIEHWQADQKELARILASPDFLQDLQIWLASEQQDAHRAQKLLGRLRISAELNATHHFSLRDTQGRRLLAPNGSTGQQQPTGGTEKTSTENAVEQLARQAVQTGQTVFGPLHFTANPPRSAANQTTRGKEIRYFFPLRAGSQASPLAVLDVQTSPEHSLYPLLKIWPGNSPSAETMLFQRMNDQILYLNDLRHLPDSALLERRTLADHQLIGSQALTQGKGFIEGTDYRGIASLAYALPVANTPWVLAAKIDRDEVFHSLRLMVAGMTTLCSLLLVALAYWLYRRKQREYTLNRLLAEYDDLYQYAPCGYHSLDRDGVIQRINQTELDMLGYRREEVVGKINVRQLLTPDGLRIFQKNFAKQLTGADVLNVEFEMIRKDGSTLPVLVKSTSLRDHKDNYLLSRTVIVDLTEQKRAETLLRESREQLRELTRHNDSIREIERKHLARELHDEFGQMLTLLKMHISLLQTQFDTLPELVDKTEEMRILVERIIGMIRNIASALRPASLDLGLSGALEWLAADFARNTGLTCNYSGPEQEPQLDETTATAIFRIVQESLTNVARHAEASRVNIRLYQDRDTLHLHISDNGRGFDVGQVTAERKNFGLIGMLGLLGMQERINMLQGHFQVSSTPGHGTHIHIELPLKPVVHP